MHTPKTRLSLHTGVPNKATTILNSFINDIFERIATEVFKLGVYSKNSSISSCRCKVPFRAARGTDLFRTSKDHMTIHRMLELLSSISNTILLFSLVLCPFPHLFLFHSLCPPLPSFFLHIRRPQPKFPLSIQSKLISPVGQLLHSVMPTLPTFVARATHALSFF